MITLLKPVRFGVPLSVISHIICILSPTEISEGIISLAVELSELYLYYQCKFPLPLNTTICSLIDHYLDHKTSRD